MPEKLSLIMYSRGAHEHSVSCCSNMADVVLQSIGRRERRIIDLLFVAAATILDDVVRIGRQRCLYALECSSAASVQQGSLFVAFIIDALIVLNKYVGTTKWQLISKSLSFSKSFFEW